MDPWKVDIVVGPPGAGKTHKLLSIMEEALTAGITPNKIGFISFTKKAADEGKNRASEKFGIPPDDLVHFRTLHSFAFRYFSMKRDQVFGWSHIRELGKKLGIEFKGRGQVEDGDVYGMNSADRMLFLEGLARNTKRPLKEIWNNAFEDEIDWWELERFTRALSSYKKNRQLSDFTDMLERFCLVDPRTLPKFELLIVDEAQDLSPLQWDAVELLAQNARNIYLGGDDDQGIFSWSGGDVRHFINLPGRVHNLEVSYRVPRTVHELSGNIISRIANRRPKVWSPRNEVGSVNWYNDIEEVDMSKGTWLLLARNGYMLDELEDWCLGQGFSFHSVNRDPLKSDSLVAIRVWENLRNGKDESAERTLDAFKYADPRMVPITLMNQLKADDPGRMYSIVQLKNLGLASQEIWHRFLTKISPKERDFFIAARRRGEALWKQPRITISTIHASKGGEADHVLLMTDMSYRCFNNAQTNPDDEVRVWYVAATRCRQSLNLIMPKTNLNFEF